MAGVHREGLERMESGQEQEDTVALWVLMPKIPKLTSIPPPVELGQSWEPFFVGNTAGIAHCPSSPSQITARMKRPCWGPVTAHRVSGLTQPSVSNGGSPCPVSENSTLLPAAHSKRHLRSSGEHQSGQM